MVWTCSHHRYTAVWVQISSYSGTVTPNHIIIYFCVHSTTRVTAAGDWLQGPYVYALYEYYGYDVKDIGRLFIAGFGSSMVVGTVVGALADK